MALSNWDTLAFDENGQPGSGRLVMPDGVGAEIYKNWLYLRHPKMWCEGGGFVKDTIAQIHHGEISIAGMEVLAGRHEDQSAIFVLVVGGPYDSRQHMCGIGCYGFMGHLEYLELRQPELFTQLAEKATALVGPEWRTKRMQDFSRWNGCESVWGFDFLAEDGTFLDEIVIPDPDPSLSDLWVGVKPSTLQAFRDWLKYQIEEGCHASTEYLNKVFETIDKQQALRFNQGDDYFASKGFADATATPVGQCEEPTISKILGAMSPKDEHNG